MSSAMRLSKFKHRKGDLAETLYDKLEQLSYFQQFIPDRTFLNRLKLDASKETLLRNSRTEMELAKLYTHHSENTTKQNVFLLDTLSQHMSVIYSVKNVLTFSETKATYRILLYYAIVDDLQIDFQIEMDGTETLSKHTFTPFTCTCYRREQAVNIERDTCRNSTCQWHNPMMVRPSMAYCSYLEISPKNIAYSFASENSNSLLSVETIVPSCLVLKQNSQDVSAFIFFLEHDFFSIFCENDTRVHLVGILIYFTYQLFCDNIIPFRQSIMGHPCEMGHTDSKRLLCHDIEKERIYSLINDPDAEVRKMCKSAIRISLSQSRMGLSKLWIPHLIDSRLHLRKVYECQFTRMKPCTREDKGKATYDSGKYGFDCSIKLSDEFEINNDAVERGLDTYAVKAEKLIKLCSNQDILDTCTAVNCNKHAECCSISVQADTHVSANFDHSLQEQRTTGIPSFDFNAPVNGETISLSKPQKPHSDQQDDHNDHIQILRELTWLPHDELPVPEIDITVANVLDPIFRDMSSGTTPGPRITMKYELLRLCTLRNYPKTNKPYIIRLAGAGFYYAADGDEVICYCCGIRRRNWTEECKPMEIHRRLSPNCSFLMKNADVNIPVPPASTEEMTRFALLKELLKDEESSDSNLGNDSVMSARQTVNQQQGNSGNAHQPTTTSRGQNPNSPAIEVPQQPKHPHYGVLNTRVGSFLGFPDGNGQDPAVLADAGFYYVGFEDCVRCFQCGVGLRHWAPEDDPWIEHCRWTLATPCPYLVKKKGEEFVSLVRMAIEITQNEPNSQSLQEDTAPHNESSVQATESSDNNTTERVEITPSVNRPGSRHGDQRQGSRPSDRNGNASKREPAPTADRAGDKRPGTKTGTKSNGQSPAAKSGTNVRKPQSDMKKDTSKTVPTKDAKGKESLSDEQRRLIAENARLRDQTICRVCCQRGVCIVFLPCGHLVSCEICAPSIRTCPICSSKVKGTVKTFMS